ncbi:MAG: hypothetical protein HQK65_18405 [Desulfamplus sp.]|nr:hypothetical protein [Desulfamplus sp.]
MDKIHNVMMDFLGKERYQVEMYIKGKNGVLIDMLSDARREKEVLFNRGHEFIIEKIKVKKSKFAGKIIMEIKEIE